MNTPASSGSLVTIETSPQSVPSTPSWFGEGVLISHHMKRQGVLSAIEEHVRFARRRFGHYDLIDFVVVLLGYAARIGYCRPCPRREECQGYGTATQKPRRVSAVLWPLDKTEEVASLPPPLHASHPILWGDWQRCFRRREVVKLLRHQRVDVRLAETAPPAPSPPVRLLSRAERAHWRLSWAERFACNARPRAAPDASIKLFGIPDAFATSLGLHIA